MIRRLYIILFLIAFLLSAHAQNSNMRQIYDQAESEYQIGRIEQAVDLLEDNIRLMPSNLKVGVFRLLALCHIALDNEKEAKRYVSLMLREDPYFTPSAQDSQKFTEMVANVKGGFTATITTASAQSEDLREVPVPTTLITEEMIHNCGARNLQEVLAAYVPGMSIVDCNEGLNIAMRGIYSNSQEKILIMLNGHRLNSYSSNVASPDFSISLDKLKQIEVLRGPASSIYGGVALTAVVNLITKRGADIDGINARIGYGNHGQLRGDIYGGKHFFDLDFAVWVSFYKSDGERVYVPLNDTGTGLYYTLHGGDVTVGGFGSSPNYDFGATIKWKDLQLMYSSQFSQAINPFTASYTYHPYNIDKYKTFNGIKPSTTNQMHHAEISYEHKFEKLYLRGAITYDNNDITQYQVYAEDTIKLSIDDKIPYEHHISNLISKYPGVFRYINGQENTLGAQLKGDLTYVSNPVHKGSIAFGAEFIHFRFDDMRYVIGYDYHNTYDPFDIGDMGKGNENSYNAFAQVKHQWKSLILNTGLRYDYKRRYADSDINEFSPRVSLIYLKPRWSAKLSYSKSFIDAPYLYRKMNDIYNLEEEFPIATSLSPETVHSIQFTLAGTEWVKGLNLELNGFYNHAKNIIYMKLTDHENMGEYKSFGLEFAGNYRQERFSANLNCTWQKATLVTIFNRERAISRIPNIPDFIANAVLSWNATKDLKLFTHLTWYTKQTAYDLDIPTLLLENQIYKDLVKIKDTQSDEYLWGLNKLLELYDKEIAYHEVAPRWVCNVGAEYRLKRVLFAFNIHNLFNAKYSQSGQGTGLVPQRGRWYMVSLGIKI